MKTRKFGYGQECSRNIEKCSGNKTKRANKGVIFSVFLGLLTIFSVFSATPVMALADCPANSIQGENVKYITEDSEDADNLKKKSVDKDGKLPSNTKLASRSQCYMHGDALSDIPLIETINTILNVILGVLGTVAVIVVILGGVQYMTSTGDPGKVQKAKNTILYGIIGLVIALLAFAIVNFVMSSMKS